MNEKILIRYVAPSKHCFAPYETLWKQMHDEESFSLFVQVSKDPEEPYWIEMGKFLEAVFKHRLTDELFIKECLKEYSDIKNF